MSPLVTYVTNLKEFVLVVCILYFYGLAFAMQFGKSLFHLDHPAVFLTMCTLYLLAVGYEIVFNWWKARLFIIWFLLWVVSYGIIGLYLAPSIFGRWILVYVFIEPLVIVFIGGFAFSVGRVLALHFTQRGTLTPDELERTLRKLPGWNTDGQSLIKTFENRDFEDALNFVNQVGRIAVSMRHYPRLKISGSRVTVRLSSWHIGGLTRTDVNQALRIDSI
jgi:4a-hydroxytetrahydrobiopterin dehydratase